MEQPGCPTHGLFSLLGVLVVLLEQQGSPDADFPPGGSAIGVIPVHINDICIASIVLQEMRYILWASSRLALSLASPALGDAPVVVHSTSKGPDFLTGSQ